MAWNDEFNTSSSIKKYKKEIEIGLEIGYSWFVKRITGQPSIITVYYGFVALAIAKYTEGIIYSDDGAWEYSSLPATYDEFLSIYMNLDTVKDLKYKSGLIKILESINCNDKI